MHAADTLRFIAAGSVDDGKSTLIGRLLFDAHALLEDQVRALQGATERHGHVPAGEKIDFSLLTDGLIAEREQGITIDVAYRYFTAGGRRFIVADTPGHEQYTRNMATGASTADVAVVLLDASRDITMQSRRHAAVAALLGIPHLVVAVNKMDLVGYRQVRFDELRARFSPWLAQLGYRDAQWIPLSALHGETVARRGDAMPWYAGETLLEHLEHTQAHLRAGGAFRLPVQYVMRSKFGTAGWRAYAGRIEGGDVRTGDTLWALPARQTVRVEDIRHWDGSRDHAAEGESVALVLSPSIDLARGDMLVKTFDPAPSCTDRFAADLCWLDEEPLAVGRRYWLKAGTRTVTAEIDSVTGRTDLESLQIVTTATLSMNDLGRATLMTREPIVLDTYRDNRATGSFILIDPANGRTVAAGMAR